VPIHGTDRPRADSGRSQRDVQKMLRMRTEYVRPKLVTPFARNA